MSDHMAAISEAYWLGAVGIYAIIEFMIGSLVRLMDMTHIIRAYDAERKAWSRGTWKHNAWYSGVVSSAMHGRGYWGKV